VSVELQILRQDGPELLATRRHETFRVDLAPSASIAAALYRIAEEPKTADGRDVSPVAFESACRGHGCGACTLLVGGHVRSACRTTLASVSPKRGPIALAPLAKFPLVRDLIVDRSGLRDRRLHAGAELGSELPEALGETHARATTDRCTECGACYEACPETQRGRFVGPAALHEAFVLTSIRAGRADRDQRLERTMRDGGVADCGKARVCIEVCPEEIPIFDSILGLERETTRRWLRTLLRR